MNKQEKDEMEKLKHEREQLATAIRDIALVAGICRNDCSLTGPPLLLLCENIKEVSGGGLWKP